MKRRFRRGVELDAVQFAEQEWLRGMLLLQAGVLYLADTPQDVAGPRGALYRPTLKACFADTISFAGIERDGDAWLAQVWFCETRAGA